MLRDGLYALRFAATHDGEPQEATGLAVLRDGTVIGSDPAGAAFTGTYEYDANRDLNRVRLRVDIAPDGVLVTGFDAGPEGTALELWERSPAYPRTPPHTSRLPARRWV
jgi:hypothetical protein